MSVRRAQDERIEGTPDGITAITGIMDVPDAPTVGTPSDVGTARAYNNAAASVPVTANATGGTPTSYTVTSSPGGFSASGTSPVTVTGLSSQTSYTFTATATNSTGTGAASAASSSVIATSVPQAPTIGTVTMAGPTSVSIPFTAGASGGKTITNYQFISNPATTTQTSTSNPYTFTGLTTDTAYTFTVAAINANGTSSASSSSNSVTPIVPNTITSYSQSGYTDRPEGFSGVNFGANNTLVLTGYVTPNYGKPLVATTDLSGNFLTAKSFTNQSGGSVRALASAIDSSGNIYVSGGGVTNAEGSGTPGSALWVVKYNSSLTYQWETDTISSFYNSSATDIILNSSGTALTYCGRWGFELNGNSAIIGQVNTSGTSVWVKRVVTQSNFSSAYSAVTEAGTSCFAGGWYYAGSMYAMIGKYTTSNGTRTALWGYQYRTGAGVNNYINDIATESGASPAYIYTVGRFTNSNGSDQSYLSKIDITNGNISWSRTLYSSLTSYSTLSTVTVDSSGNVYVGGISSSPGSIILAKYNSSGTLQWKRRLSATSIGGPGQIRVTGSRMYVVLELKGATSDTYPNAGLLHLPSDGSKTGTYTVNGTTYTYADATSDTDASLTSPSVIDLSSSYADTTGSSSASLTFSETSETLQTSQATL